MQNLKTSFKKLSPMFSTCVSALFYVLKRCNISIFVCIAICNPGCENGGKCLAHNKCLCPRGFRGMRCQYCKCFLFNLMYKIYLHFFYINIIKKKDLYFCL